MFGIESRDLFEDKVGFSVGDTALDGRAYAGGFVWIEEIHVDANVDSVDVLGCCLEGFVDDIGDSVVIDVGHRKCCSVAVAYGSSFWGIEISQADPDDV